MSSTAPSPIPNANLFRNAHNVPLKCFIQLDSRLDQAAELKKVLEVHGANVSPYLDEALVILVDPPTPGGQHLIREYGTDANRAILDFSWVRRCVEKGRCIGPGESWGGHRLPVTNVNDFFAAAPPPPSQQQQQQQQQQQYQQQYQQATAPRNVPPSHPQSLPSAASHPSLPQRESYPKSVLPVPPRPIGMQAGHPRYAARSPAVTALPSPAISQSRPLSPGSSYTEHHADRDRDRDRERDRDRGGRESTSLVAAKEGEHPIEWHSWTPPADNKEVDSPPIVAPTPAVQQPVVSSRPPTPDTEPTPPDQTQIVMHHNGMGAKFTDADSTFIREYFRWSMKHHPGRTNRQVLDCLHEKMPYHSAVSTAQYIRRHADRFPEYVKKDERVGPKKKGPVPSASDAGADVELPVPMEPYDPALVGEDGCPLPPKSLIPFATGFRFTMADTQYVIAFFNWYLNKFPEATRAQILRELTNKAPYRSLPSWSNFFHKNQEKWKTLIKGLRDIPEGDLNKEGSPSIRGGPSSSLKAPRRNGGSSSTSTSALAPAPSPTATDHPKIDVQDARRWTPARQHPSVQIDSNGNGHGSSHSGSHLPTPGEREDGEYFENVNGTFLPVPVVATPSSMTSAHRDRQASSTSSSTTSSLRTHMVGDGGTPKDKDRAASSASGAPEKPRRADYGTRRTSKPFTSQEKLVFIEFLADHPWVWSHANAKPEWLKGGTTASATWQKFEKIQPHRSDACWREYHKRNAQEFDAAAKRLRTSREAGDPDSSAQTALAQGQAEHPNQGRQHDKGLTERYEEEYEAEDHHGHDYEDEDGDDDGGEYAEEEDSAELPGSSFSYAPIPVEATYNEEDDGDEMVISEGDDDNGSNYGGNMAVPSASARSGTGPAAKSHHPVPKMASTRGKGGSRRGRPYVPFSQVQAAQFAEFLVDHPQIWSAATPEEGWVSDKVMREGKDATWKLLAAMPGMDNHSFKSWREYHRVRAMQYDPIAKAARMAREAVKQETKVATPPPSPPRLSTKIEVEAEAEQPASASMEMPGSSTSAAETLVTPRTEDGVDRLSPGPTSTETLPPRKRSREPTAADEDYDDEGTPDRIVDGTAVKRLRVSEPVGSAENADVEMGDAANTDERKMEADPGEESKVDVETVAAPAA
ncbi:hypothetical protein FRB97_000419 [Tulasnella sp. 331]|nr:hypothetical protein FRB97_000419 [Tulasnella sp. 331]